MHGVAHVIVENQVAAGDSTVVPVTLARLMREGLDRHDAIHAIGSVLMGIVFDVITEKADTGVDINAPYGRELGLPRAGEHRHGKSSPLFWGDIGPWRSIRASVQRVLAG